MTDESINFYLGLLIPNLRSDFAEPNKGVVSLPKGPFSNSDALFSLNLVSDLILDH